MTTKEYEKYCNPEFYGTELMVKFADKSWKKVNIEFPINKTFLRNPDNMSRPICISIPKDMEDKIKDGVFEYEYLARMLHPTLKEKKGIIYE